jgi:hypothetical protein
VPTNVNKIQIPAVLAVLTLIACGGSGASSSATLGPAGGTVATASTTLTVPAGALPASTTVTIRETEPRHAGRHHRVEIEPSGIALSSPAHVSVRVDDSNVKIKIHGEDDSLREVEVEDKNHHRHKTSISKLESIEVEVEHGRTCSTACGAGEECDDGVCKPHGHDDGARVCSDVCASGLECDDGVCKPHGHDDADGGVAGAAVCDPGCATGLECDANEVRGGLARACSFPGPAPIVFLGGLHGICGQGRSV